MESALAPGKSEALDRLIMRVLQQGYGLLGGPWTKRATDVGDDIAVDRCSFSNGGSEVCRLCKQSNMARRAVFWTVGGLSYSASETHGWND